MSYRKKKKELQRLINDFELEASQYHDISFSTYVITQNPNDPNLNVKFRQPNHAIRLWQYYGHFSSNEDISRFYNNLANSDMQWAVRGAELTQIGVVEGDKKDLFIRMAERASGLFNKKQIDKINWRALNEVKNSPKISGHEGKFVGITNANPIAIWLNYLLYHLSQFSPEKSGISKIYPEPFALSLLALERLLDEQEFGKIDKSTTNIKNIKFKIALSFPGEKRNYVSQVVDSLKESFGDDTIFYDFDYKAQLAQPNLDVLLQNIYLEQSQLNVIFVCEEYNEKEWCGLEWRAIRQLIKQKKDEKIMFISFGGATIPGMFETDGYVDAEKTSPTEIASHIITRTSIDDVCDANQ